MKALRDSSDLVQRTFQAMPLRQRAFVTVMTVAVLAGAFMLFQRGNQSATEYLFGGRSLADQELDSVEIAFSRAGLNGWQRDQTKIKIPTEKRNEYLAALDDNAALPVSLRSTVQQAIDKASLFESTSQRVSRERHAKQQDLGGKLAAFPEIRWASVEHDEGERQGFSGVRTQSASVVVCPEGTAPLPISRIETIREFISGSYADMIAADVVVIDTNADPNSCHITDPIAHRQHEEQARLEQEVLEALQGYGTIRVNAHVDLNAGIAAGTPSQSKIIRQPSVKSQTTTSEPDLLNELFNRVTRVKANSSKRVKPAIVPSAISVHQASESAIPSKPTIGNVHLSIGLPDSYFQKTWKRLAAKQGSQSAEIAPERLTKLQEYTEANILAAVRPAVLARTPIAAAHNVDVYSYPDSEPEAALPLISEPAIAALGLGSQQLMIVGVIALIVIGILLSSLRSKQQPEPTTSLVPQSENSLAIQPSTVNVDDELTTLVKDNPDRAIEVIQAWLTEAA